MAFLILRVNRWCSSKILFFIVRWPPSILPWVCGYIRLPLICSTSLLLKTISTLQKYYRIRCQTISWADLHKVFTPSLIQRWGNAFFPANDVEGFVTLQSWDNKSNLLLRTKLAFGSSANIPINNLGILGFFFFQCERFMVLKYNYCYAILVSILHWRSTDIFLTLGFHLLGEVVVRTFGLKKELT